MFSQLKSWCVACLTKNTSNLNFFRVLYVIAKVGDTWRLSASGLFVIDEFVGFLCAHLTKFWPWIFQFFAITYQLINSTVQCKDNAIFADSHDSEQIEKMGINEFRWYVPSANDDNPMFFTKLSLGAPFFPLQANCYANNCFSSIW